MPMAKFGSLLKGYREQAGYAEEELATLARISVRGLRYLERGGTSPTPRVVRRLASALSLTPAQEATLVAAAQEVRPRSVASTGEPAANRVAPAEPAPARLEDLPGQLTKFIGREATLTLASDRLVADRLVTLVGAGGCGKTRVAIEVGRLVRAARPEGVFFADLSGLSDPVLVPGALLRALGLRRYQAGRPPTCSSALSPRGTCWRARQLRTPGRGQRPTGPRAAHQLSSPGFWRRRASRPASRRDRYRRRGSRGSGLRPPRWSASARKLGSGKPVRRPGTQSQFSIQH